VTPLRGEKAGLELFILIDDASAPRLALILEDLRTFIVRQPASTAVGIAYMHNGTARILQEPTANHQRAIAAISIPLGARSVMSSPYLALEDLMVRWPDSARRHEVVMVTSGIDPLGDFGFGNAYLDRAIERAQRKSVVVFGLYTVDAGRFGRSAGRIFFAQNHLTQLARETGGEAYMLGIEAPISFHSHLKDIEARLANQYLVTLITKPETKVGLQSFRLVSEAPNAEIVAAKQVYVP